MFLPKGLGQADVDELKQRLGIYRSAGQLPQRPAPLNGGLFQ
jgi:hypothetical protein